VSGRPGRFLVAPAVLVALAAGASATGTQAPPVPRGAELAALATSPARSLLSSQRVYFVMTDRFENGDPSNDRGGKTGDFAVTGYAPTETGAFHGGDLAGLTARLDYIRDLGATAIWLTPPFVQRTTQGATAGYHGYWGVDFTRVDPHFGTNDTFRAFVNAAHADGLRVILDVVVNHTGDVISYAGAGVAGAAYVEQATRPYRDTHGRPFDPTRYAGKATFPPLYPDRRSFPYQPVVRSADRSVKQPAWLNDVRNYHNRGDSTLQGESLRFGDFYGLDDLFTERPEVVHGLVDLYAGWVKTYRLDGFRLDTARHVDDRFLRAFVPAMLRAGREAGVSDFMFFGEVFDTSSTSTYVRKGLLPSVLDFSFQQAVVPYAAGGRAAGLAALFDQDDLYTTARSSAYDLVTFLGNHDLGRVGYFLTQGAEVPALAADLLAHDVLFLTRGAPAVYYGDEVGMTGTDDGKDRNARQDMFATRVPLWQSESRIGAPAVGTGPSFDLTHQIAARIAALSRLVQQNPALRNGAQITRLASGPVFAASRIDLVARREYVVVFNSSGQNRTVLIQTSTPASPFTNVWPGEGGGSESDEAGRVRVTIAPRSTLVLRAGMDLPDAPRPTVRLRTPVLDRLLGAFRLRADTSGRDPAAVTFLYRREGSTRWTRLGTDDAAPFRVYLDSGRVPPQGGWVTVAIRSSSGAVAVAPPQRVARS
jgi:glycosidase